MFHPVHPRRHDSAAVLDADEPSLAAPSGIALLHERSTAALQHQQRLPNNSTAVTAGASTTTGVTAAPGRYEELFPSFFSRAPGAAAAAANTTGDVSTATAGALRGLPSVPYYGLLRKLLVEVGQASSSETKEVATAGSKRRHQPAAEGSVGVAACATTPDKPPVKAARAEDTSGPTEGPEQRPVGVGLLSESGGGNDAADRAGQRLQKKKLSSREFETMVDRHCGHYRFGSRHVLREAADPPPNHQMTRSARQERYARYIDALCDAYRAFRQPFLDRRRRMAEARGELWIRGDVDCDAPSSASPPPFQGFYVVCNSHPRWKSFTALFFEEGGPQTQQVAVIAEGKGLQRVLTAACLAAGAASDDVVWLNDALLLTTGVRFGHDQVDAVDVVFDTLLNLQDAVVPRSDDVDGSNHRPPFDRSCSVPELSGLLPPGATTGSAGSRSRGAATAGGSEQADAALLADSTVILAPFPFRGGEWQRFRPLRRPAQHSTSPRAASQCWSIGDALEAGDVLLPSAVSGLARELLRNGVSFAFFFSPVTRCAAQVVKSNGQRSPTAAASPTGAAMLLRTVQRDTPATGVVGAASEGSVAFQAPWLALSRLSSDAWLSHAEVVAARRAAGLPVSDNETSGHNGDDADDDAAEAVFVPISLQCVVDGTGSHGATSFHIQNRVLSVVE